MYLVDLRKLLVLIAVALTLPAAAVASPSSARSSTHHRPAQHKSPHANRTRRSTRCHRRRYKHRRCAKPVACAKHSRRHCIQRRHTSRKVSRHSSKVRSSKLSAIAEAAKTTATPSTTGEAPTLTITGKTYYVSPSGSDSNSGTSPSSPWRTVKQVNEATLAPGDGVLFEGGATFPDETLMPSASGAAGSPIIFGSYGQGNATLPKGVWFRGHNYLAFEHLTIGPEGNLQGTGNGVVLEWCAVGNDGTGINAMGSNWTIDNNTVDHTGNSGMLLEGESFTVSGNTITNTGLDSSIAYGKHGIYLKVSNATVTNNTITNFSDAGISVRYRNSTLTGNHISGGPFGIAWFQYDPIAGTSHWTDNTIAATTTMDIYVSRSDIGGNTRESFVITNNSLQKAAGGYMDLQPTTGTYTTLENTLL